MSRAVAIWASLVLAATASCSSSDDGVHPPSSNKDAGVTGTGGQAGNGSGGGGAGGSTTGTGGAGGSGIIVGTPEGGTQNDSGGCASSTVKAELIPANMLFVIDRSGSMNCNLPPITSSSDCEAKPERVDASRPSKWEIIRDALKSAFASLPSTASAGIAYF